MLIAGSAVHGLQRMTVRSSGMVVLTEGLILIRLIQRAIIDRNVGNVFRFILNLVGSDKYVLHTYIIFNILPDVLNILP